MDSGSFHSGSVVLRSRTVEAPFVLRAADGRSRWPSEQGLGERQRGVALLPSRKWDERSERWDDWEGRSPGPRPSEPHRLVTTRDHGALSVHSEEHSEERGSHGRSLRSFSYSYSRSRSRGPGPQAAARSPSPLSVGSSEASNKRRVPVGQSLPGEAKRTKKKVRRRVAKVAVAPPAAPVQAPLPVPPVTVPLQGKAAAIEPGARLKRRTRLRREAPPAGPGPRARRTAAKSAPVRPRPKSAPSNVMDVELTPAEQQELKDSVVKHVRQTVQADDDEPDILAEFICVLLDQRKSKSEMLEELAVMDDEAQPFVKWLETEKASLVARRKPSPWERRRAAQETVTKALEDVPDKPPGQFMPLTRAPAFLTPNSMTSLEESKGERPQDRGLVVITNRLILQPNTVQRPEEDLEAESAAEKKAEEAHQKKMDLLAEMTKKLQVILERLSDKNLADDNRERYQSMAQTIQNRMASLSRREKMDRAYAYGYYEKEEKLPAGTGTSDAPIVLSPET